MGRKRTSSPALRKMEQRLSGLKSINPTLELRNGKSVAEGEALKAKAHAAEEEYSIMLSNIEAKRHELNSIAKELTTYCKDFLTGVKSDFGDDSVEYGKAGGVRLSQRAKPQRKGLKKGEV